MSKIINSNNKIFIFIGSPGSGKGSLAKLCVKHFGWEHFAMGDVCRFHVVQKTDYAKQMDFLLRAGKLIPDDLIVSMADSWLQDWVNRDSSLILDGYPRTLIQAKTLSKILSELKVVEPVVVNFIVKDKTVVKRLSDGRLTCSNSKCGRIYSLAQGTSIRPKNDNFCDECNSSLVNRNDDANVNVIRKRIKVYHENVIPILEFYKKYGIRILTLDVEKNLEDVFIDFKRVCFNDNN